MIISNSIAIRKSDNSTRSLFRFKIYQVILVRTVVLFYNIENDYLPVIKAKYWTYYQ